MTKLTRVVELTEVSQFWALFYHLVLLLFFPSFLLVMCVHGGKIIDKVDNSGVFDKLGKIG
jgi:hypothetical protein